MIARGGVGYSTENNNYFRPGFTGLWCFLFIKVLSMVDGIFVIRPDVAGMMDLIPVVVL